MEATPRIAAQVTVEVTAEVGVRFRRAIAADVAPMLPLRVCSEIRVPIAVHITREIGLRIGVRVPSRAAVHITPPTVPGTVPGAIPTTTACTTGHAHNEWPVSKLDNLAPA
jgi:hypothetical protein